MVKLKSITENASFEAKQLCAYVFGVSSSDVIISGIIASVQQIETLNKLAAQRLDGYPLQYIIKQWEFYGITLEVGEGVLIPRPETELAAEIAINELSKTDGRKKVLNFLSKTDGKKKVLDLCSGSGCIAIAIKANSNADVYALELCQNALYYLRRNIKKNNADITVIEGDLHNLKLTENLAPFDIITANPPYLSQHDMNNLQKEVSHEPKTALYGGKDGLDFYRFIIKEYKSLLIDKGMLILEIGINAKNEIKQLLENNGYKNIKEHKDLSGIVRVITVDN